MRQIAVGQRDAGIGAAAGRGGDARHYLAVDTALQKEFQFLGTAAEDERVAALESHHALVLQGQVGQQLVDRTSTRLNSGHSCASRMPSSACKKNIHNMS